MANLPASIDRILGRAPGNRPRADWVVCDVANKIILGHSSTQAAALRVERDRNRDGRPSVVYTAYEAKLRGYHH